MTWLIAVAVTSLLISINALYVAAEFSAVSARRSRLSQLASDGNRLAQTLLPIVEDPRLLDRFVATCQLGITISSLTLGFYGTSQIAPLINSLFSGADEQAARLVQSVSAIAVLLFLTTLQVIFGELVPKNIALLNPERLALVTSTPIRWSTAIFRPLIWFFNGSAQVLMRIFGMTSESVHVHVHAPEEILMLVEESEAGGLLPQVERRLLENALQFRDLFVRQVMIPRPKLLAASVDIPSEEALALLADSTYSRLLLYDGTIDNVVGLAHLKDLFCLHQITGQEDVRTILRPVPFVPETMKVEEVMYRMQRDRMYVAIVIDEFGGTAGMVTLKDLVEEIFGEFADEFEALIPEVRLGPDERLSIRGDVLIRELNEWLDLYLSADEVDTIGGLVLSEFKQVPEVGEEVQINQTTFRVESMEGRAVEVVSMEVSPEQADRLKEAGL